MNISVATSTRERFPSLTQGAAMTGQSMPADPSDRGLDTQPLVANIGDELRTLRTQASLSVAKLAARSGVSSGLISQIERGLGNPSFNTLAQLAYALEIPIGRLLDSATPASPVVRLADRRVLDAQPPQSLDALHELLTPYARPGMEATWITAPPGYDTSETPFKHDGEEFGIVLSGVHEVHVAGERHVLQQGDSIIYDSGKTHWYRNPGPDPVHAIWVHSPTKAKGTRCWT